MYVVVPTNSYTKNKHDCVDKTLQLEQKRCNPQGYFWWTAMVSARKDCSADKRK